MPSVTTSISASGELVAAPANSRQFIKVLGYQISSDGDPGIVKLQSGTTDKAQVTFFGTAGGQCICPPVAGQSEPYFICEPGQALNASLGSSVATLFNIQYVLLGAT